MGKQALDDAIRTDVLARLTNLLSQELDCDVMPISPSELVMPTVDSEGNEKFVRIAVSVPRGSRNGKGGYDPYDGYALAEEWKETVELKKEEALAKAEKKQQKEEEKQRKREARKKSTPED